MPASQHRDTYQAAWRHYRRVLLAAWVLLPGLFALALASAYLLPDGYPWLKGTLTLLFFFLWALSALVIMALLHGFQCPRWGNLFFVTCIIGRLNPATPKCYSCGLPKFAKSDASSPPDPSQNGQVSRNAPQA